MRKLSTRVYLITVIIIFAVVIFVVGMGVVDDAGKQAFNDKYDQQSTQTKAAQQSLVSNKYSDLPTKLCTHPVTTESGIMPQNLKLVVIKSADNTIYQDYNQALPLANQAQGQADLSAIACIEEDTSFIYAKDPYKSLGSSDETAKNFCNHHRTDFDVYLVDVRAGQTIKRQKFTGQEVDLIPCPSLNSSDIDWSAFGKPPAPAEVVGWILERAATP